MQFELRQYYFVTLLLYFAIGWILCLSFPDRRKNWFVSDIFNSLFVIFLIYTTFHVSTTQPYTDMVRMNQDIDLAHSEGVQYLFKIYSTVPLSALLLSVGVYAGTAVAVQALSVLIFYSAFFVSLGFLKRYVKADPAVVLLFSVLILLTVNYTGVSFNLRFWPAAALTVLGITLIETHREKQIYGIIAFILFVISLLMHFGVLALLLVYGLVWISRDVSFTPALLFLLFYSPILIHFIPLLVSSGNSYISMIGSKSQDYFGLSDDYDSSYDATRPISWWLFVYIIIVLFFLIYFVYRKTVKTKLLSQNFDRLMQGMAAFLLSSVASYTTAARFAIIASMLCAPMFLLSLENYFSPTSFFTNYSSQLYKEKRILRHILFLVTCITIALLMLQRYKTTYVGYYVTLL